MGKSFLSKHPSIKKMSKSLKSSFKSKKLRKVQKNGVYTFEEEKSKSTTTPPAAVVEKKETTTTVDVLEKRTSEMSVSSNENETEVALVPEEDEDKMDEEESPIIEESPSAEVQSSFAAVLTEMMTCTDEKKEEEDAAILPPAAEEESPKEEEESPDVEPSHTNEEPGVETVQQDDRVTIGFYQNDKAQDAEAPQEEQEPGVMANALALMEQYLSCGFSPGGTPIEPEVVVIDTQEVKKLSLPMEETEEESPEMEDGRDAEEAAPAAELQAEIRA